MQRPRKIFCFVLLALLLAGVWIYRPLSAPEPGELDPRIRALSPPFTILSYDLFLDGGSVMLKVKDSKGKEAAITFKASGISPNDFRFLLATLFHPEKLHPKAYWGDLESAYEKPVELEKVDAARLWAASLVHVYAERTQYSSVVSFQLTGRWRFVGEMIYYGWIKGRTR